jgi:DNA-binding response OmpR family regulator
MEERGMEGNSRTTFISDDLETTQLFAYALQRENIATTVVGSTAEAVDHHRGRGRHLLVINNCADQIDVFAFCEQARERCDCPFLLLDYSTDEPYIARTYRAGIDEYITKPLGLRLFQLKIAAWLRRAVPGGGGPAAPTARDGLRLDFVRSQLIKPCGSVVDLTNLEFRLLHLLLRHPNEVCDRQRIIEHVWGANGEDGYILVKNLVYRLRRKIEPDPQKPSYLQTVYGRGYKLELQED